EIPWPRGGRRFDEAERTVAEFQRCDRGVLGLDFYKRGEGPRMDADDVAEKPFQHVDMMARLVGQYAAIIGPCPAPVVLVIVGLVAAPAHASRAENEPAEPSRFQRFARL